MASSSTAPSDAAVPGTAVVSDPQPASPPPAPTDLLPKQVVANKGESLTKVVTRYYPNQDRTVLNAVILANPEITTENVIHPGQVINLPKINWSEETIQLEDGLLYALYGSYYAAASWQGDKPWLEKNQVRFLVRVTREASGKTIHRIFLGGYEKLADLQEAQKRLRIKSRRARVSRREEVSVNIPLSDGENRESQEKPSSQPEKPASVVKEAESSSLTEPLGSQLDLQPDSRGVSSNLSGLWLKFLTFIQSGTEFDPCQNALEVWSTSGKPSEDQEAAIARTSSGGSITDNGPPGASSPWLKSLIATPAAAEIDPCQTALQARPAPGRPSEGQDSATSEISLARDITHDGTPNPGASWLKFLAAAPAAAELDPCRNALAAMPLAETPPAAPTAQISLAGNIPEEGVSAAENSHQEPAAETGVAKAPAASDEKVRLPERILPPAAYALQVLKSRSDIVCSLKRYWEAQSSVLAVWWHHLTSLLPSMLPAHVWSPRNEAALGDIKTGEGKENPVLSLAKEVASGPEDPPLAPIEPMPLEKALPTNIRRFLEAGGTFRIENREPQDPKTRSSEPYIEPTPGALGGYLEFNGIPLPANVGANGGRPLREVSWPGGEQPPLPASPEKALPPDGTVRRYRDVKGVWHIVNGEPKDPLHQSGALLAESGPEVKGSPEGSNEPRPPADSQANRGPLKRASWPGGEPASPAPPESRTPEKALLPEGTIRRYRDAKGVLRIVNSEPKDPLHQSGTLLAESGPEANGPQEKSNEPRPPADGQANRGAIRKVAWPGGESAPPAPPESRPRDQALLAEGTIRRYRDGKGVLHIESVEYPKPTPWPASIHLARNMPPSIPGKPAEGEVGAASRFPPKVAASQVVAFKDQQGRLHIDNPALEELARRTALELHRASLDPIIIEAAFSYGLPVPLVQALIKVESNFVPWAVSPKGAMGLMQLMPGTATFLGVGDPFSPRENIMGGCRYLRLLLNCFNENLALALAAYNAGYQRVIDAGFRVPEITETQNFVTEVLARYYTITLARRPSGA